VLQEILKNFGENRLLQSILTMGLSYFVSVSSIPVIITISRLKNLMDVPGERSSHEIKTPTLGGVAIFASVLIGYFITQGLWPSKEGDSIINLTIVAIVILFFLGVKDDILVLSPAKKMVLQVASSALVIIGCDLRINTFFGIFNVYELPYLLSVGLSIFVFIALINAMNLIDGIDGLAGSIGFLASFIFGIWFFLNKQFALVFLSSAVCGSILGFLRFNFSKTRKIFMGDTGSLILGFILTVFAIKFMNLNDAVNPNKSIHYAYGSAPILAIIVLVVPIFDTLRVFIVRILNKKSPFEGDRNHLHHILIDLGFSHFQASFSLTIITSILVILFATFRHQLSNNQSLILLSCLFFAYLGVCQLLKNKVKKIEDATIEKEIKDLTKI
jgi:UDP-GlcNAc:undecaprenyl-phosphate/decaprenyl-phosphate GlcNAc-1-phosphate transferase